MASREELYSALRNADAAGDSAGAQKLAAYIQSLPAETAPPVTVAPAETESGTGLNPERAKLYASEGPLDSAKRQLSEIGADTKRLGVLGMRAINKAGVRTLTSLGDLSIWGANKLTGSDYTTPGQSFEDWQDTKTTPPQNKGEALAEQAMQFAAGAKLPISGGAKTTGAVSPSQQTALTARQASYKLPPSEIPSAGATMRAAGKFAGSRQTMEAAAEHNIAQTPQNIASEFGLPKGTEITPDTLKSVRKGADAAGYEPIRQLGKGYADLINTIREAREKVTALYQDYARNKVYATLQDAKTAQASAQNAEKVLDGAVKQLGQPELYENYVRARQLIAKTGDAERALVESTGDFKPGTLAKEFASGGRSGAIEAAGRTAEAVPKAFKPAPMRNLFGLTDRAIGGLGVLGGVGTAMMHDPRYLEAGGALLAGRLTGQAMRGGVRKALLSEPIQDYMTYLTPDQRREALARALTAGVASN